ncbi:MAG TPA: RagB/SusD family nutrient uptake outer membrane protein [Gemmatimonadaceae bacterium]|nr:RagB/SusD family nutrient uptake outer membrane protein [Gemmatimonadaceae bacterium]
MTNATRTIVRRAAGLVLAVATLNACKDTAVPDLNSPSLEGIITNPTRAQVETMARGILDGNRTSQAGYIRDLEIIGRDAYNLDGSDPRWVTELLINLDPGGFGARHWGDRYRNVKSANVLISAVETSGALNSTEKSATIGFAQTIKALDLLAVEQARDTAGIAADAGTSPDALAPVICRDNALTRISALLDSARTALLAGGSAFPFPLPGGFAGFDTPASFAMFNRAIKARTELLLGPTGAAHYTAALTALSESFADTTASLDLGVYHFYSLAAGDQGNGLAQDTATTNFRAHPSVRGDAEPGDQRVARKTAISSVKGFQGVSSNVVFTVYDSPTSPIPIVRNEELVLLRAEANIGLGNVAAAMRDINYVRVHSAGLAPRTTITTAAAALTQLLYEKRYSLLWESGSRWVDARLYGKLGTLPLDQPTHKVHYNFQIPTAEVLARGGSVRCQ